MIVLIPAYEPDDELVKLVESLRAADPSNGILVVDDGSGPAFESCFAAVQRLGAELISFEQNRGKGAALKAGFVHALEQHPGESVVTADSDGQHTPADILRVAARMERQGPDRDAIVLGVRTFAAGVPARSRFGNAVSAWVFALATGFPVSDTQTGLRGIPAQALRWATTVPGERFEYELEVLLASRDAGIRVTEVPIETIYLARNASSHFRPLRDSVRVMRPMLRFAGSSMLSFVVDTVLVQIMFWATGSLLASVILARLGSGSMNFALNRAAFGARAASLRRALTSYVLLAIVLLAANYAWLSLLTSAGLALVPSKIITEIALYVVSFAVQRTLVFARSSSSAAPLRSSTGSSAAHRKPKGSPDEMELVTNSSRRQTP